MPSETEKVTIYYNDQRLDVPKGMNLVDAAKFYANDDIPVFCYHPKMEPVGMCRMCLVEMGGLVRNPETKEIEYEADGSPKVRWFPKLQTACTQTCTPDLVVRTTTPAVIDARDDVIEFLLSSHPLDCPICDKGGECPLQNLTMQHGGGKSRFYLEDKKHLEKHYPLGDLIFLDRERCIQCARCVRFCDEVVGDPVLGFHERGRALQIVTISEPPFDTYFSGNTTDICPVGALTTADFRFGARPWELNNIPSLDPYGPEGANVSLSTRLDREAGGKTIIKRVMPRQNEYVNEIWISDKTRFGHHHSRAENRLTQPLIRRDGALQPATWDEALDTIAGALRENQGGVGAVAGPMLSNEDLWELRGLVEKAGGSALGVWPATMTGADIVAQAGVGKGTNLKDLGNGSTILVIGSDLEEEAPIWFLRVKRAGDDRGVGLAQVPGARIMVANGRETKLDKYADCTLRYQYGEAVNVINNLISAVLKAKTQDERFIADHTDGVKDIKPSKTIPAGYDHAAAMLAGIDNLVIFVGAEGMTLEQHGELMQAAANLLALTGHLGRPNNGIIPVWPGANTQGAFDLGYRAEATREALGQSVVFLAGADPVGSDPEAEAALKDAKLVVAISLFETPTTDLADIVLPRQSVPERDGSFTNGERRVQRFYTAQPSIGDTRPDWKLFAETHRKLDPAYRIKLSAGAVMAEITQHVPRYAEMSYKNLAKIERQFPDVGGDDLYYGGTAYDNRGGIGVQWAVDSENADFRFALRPVENASAPDGLFAVPVRVLYDRSPEFLASSELMQGHITQPYVALSPADANKYQVNDGQAVKLTLGGQTVEVAARVQETTPEGVVLVPQFVLESSVPLAPGSAALEI